MAEQSGYGRYVQFLQQHISVNIQRGYYYCVLGTVNNLEAWTNFFHAIDSKKGKSSTLSQRYVVTMPPDYSAFWRNLVTTIPFAFFLV